jgi:hypothetical protein
MLGRECVHVKAKDMPEAIPAHAGGIRSCCVGACEDEALLTIFKMPFAFCKTIAHFRCGLGQSIAL